MRRRTAALAMAGAMTILAFGPAALASRMMKPAAALSTPLAWTDGNTLARSQAFLQTAWASDCPPPSGRCATDRGPYVGVFWQRAARATPGTWSKPRRLSLPHQQAERPAVASNGTNVYVAWVTQTSYLHYRPKSPRTVWIRASSNQGATWGAAHAVSTPGSRADFPVIAASDDAAWVVWTGAGSGSILMASTTTNGAHWTAPAIIGTTTSGKGSPEGYQGFPAIGASGANVMAAWILGPAGKQVAVVSHTLADDWSSPPTPIPLTPQSPNDGVHYPVVRGADDGESDHVAVAYATATGIQTRTYDGSSLGQPAVVAGPWTRTSTYAGGYGAAAIPFGADDVAVVWSGCRRVAALMSPCRPSRKQARIDLMERESTDGGTRWTPVFRLSAATTAVPVNEAPSLEADGANGHRSFVWLRRTANWINYRVWIRNGSVRD